MGSIRRPALVGYVIVVALVLIGFMRIEATQSKLDREVRTRQAAVCASYDQLKAVLGAIISATGDQGDAPVPEGLDPALEALIERSRESSARFRDRAIAMLQEAECPQF